MATDSQSSYLNYENYLIFKDYHMLIWYKPFDIFDSLAAKLILGFKGCIVTSFKIIEWILPKLSISPNFNAYYP